MLKVEYVPKDSLRMYENNAKEHPAEQIEQIKKSIKEFGFNDPIAVWNDTIVEGHGRLLAADELGLEEVPIIRLDHLTDEQRRAYTLVHNKLTMNSGFNLELLSLELDSITSYDMTEFGFDASQIEIEDIDGEFLEPEEPIARELGEANNYVVLEFMTEADWNDAITILGLKTVQTADKNVNIRRHGIGRVIDGAEVLERLKSED